MQNDIVTENISNSNLFKQHLQALVEENGNNITEYANIIGVSPSTISRILQGTSTGSRDLAYRVFNNLKANSKVTSEMIMEDINQMPQKPTRTSTGSRTTVSDFSDLSRYETTTKLACRDRLVNELLKRTPNVIMSNSSIGFFNADLAIRTDAISGDGLLHDWVLIISGKRFVDTSVDAQDAVKRFVSLIGCAHLFSLSLPFKMSLVLSSGLLFNAVKDLTKSIDNCEDLVSIIHCDPDGGTIEEHFLPRRNHSEAEIVYPFKRPSMELDTNIQTLVF